MRLVNNYKWLVHGHQVDERKLEIAVLEPVEAGNVLWDFRKVRLELLRMGVGPPAVGVRDPKASGSCKR